MLSKKAKLKNIVQILQQSIIMNQYQKVDETNLFFSKHFVPEGVKMGKKGF